MLKSFENCCHAVSIQLWRERTQQVKWNSNHKKNKVTSWSNSCWAHLNNWNIWKISHRVSLALKQARNVYTLLSINPAELWNFRRYFFYCFIKKIFFYIFLRQRAAEVAKLLYFPIYFITLKRKAQQSKPQRDKSRLDVIYGIRARKK